MSLLFDEQALRQNNRIYRIDRHTLSIRENSCQFAAKKVLLRFFVPSSLRGNALVNSKFALTAAFLINILKPCCETFWTPVSILTFRNASGGPVAAFCVLCQCGIKIPSRRHQDTKNSKD